jgi:hypothetical protein
MSEWGWPQWVYAGLLAIVPLLTAVLHGMPRTGKHDFWLSVCASGIGAWLLWMGGFWS